MELEQELLEDVAPLVERSAPLEIGPSRHAHTPGHFYSPDVNPDELSQRQGEIWPAVPRPLLGIPFDDELHKTVLTIIFPRYMPDYNFVEDEDQVTTEYEFYTRNSQFSWLDSRATFVLLREWRPKRIIEVGSGFSSLLMADINRRFWNLDCDLTCIEPYPRPFLKAGVPGLTHLIEDKVQTVALSVFDRLEAGDVLFIDSSHVSKTGSDVNYLYFEVLPRLKAGVKIHIHDIFFPHDYPKDWVLGEARSWNEQYVLRALLMYSNAFKVYFANNYAFTTMPNLVQQALAHPEGRAFGGGSIWIERL
jgi:hypothetical protein